MPQGLRGQAGIAWGQLWGQLSGTVRAHDLNINDLDALLDSPPLHHSTKEKAEAHASAFLLAATWATQKTCAHRPPQSDKAKRLSLLLL